MSRPGYKTALIGKGTDVVVFQPSWKPSPDHQVMPGRVIIHLGPTTDDNGAEAQPALELNFYGNQLESLRDAFIEACQVCNDDGSLYVEPQA